MQRLNKTMGYPDNKLAMNDYCAALEVMETFEGVRALMDELARTDLIRTPTAAGIRSMAYDRMRDTLAQRRACTMCDGSGVQTVWKLITYQGKSYSIKRAEALPNITSQEQANEFARGVQAFLNANPEADRQQVLSAAKACGCSKPRALVG
jgi:uncharacterized protein YqkB